MEYSFDTIIIGTGCAGYNAADTLYDLGHRNIAIITEGINMGTSRNTGSDKQTYYKLSLCGNESDSVYEMAADLFGGGAVNGDTALCEAAGSVRSFMKLVNIGVRFPTNAYGEYVGYKTDHDKRRRATSCGPLTSKLMTERLEQSVMSKGIKIFDHMQAVRIVTSGSPNKRVAGLIALDLEQEDPKRAVTLFRCKHIVMATGGPAIVYDRSVYPPSQTGMTGMALLAGARAANLSEWQYGLASTKFRWNVSGTYQQVLPRYMAVDKHGNMREFLPEYFDSPQQALSMVFLKGYQWPFDVRKINGSSYIDRIIHTEVSEKGNRVFMDFCNDPMGLENGLTEQPPGLSDEAYEYLSRSGALVSTPIERLRIMNPKAIELYKDNGIDITNEPLEVNVCAQHCNGGIDVDLNWQSSIEGLYVVGEAAGTFGVARPGGSALNSTQVGSLRAAEHIASLAARREESTMSCDNAMREIRSRLEIYLRSGSYSSYAASRKAAQQQMSTFAAHIRDVDRMREVYDELSTSTVTPAPDSDATATGDIYTAAYAFKNADMLITQRAVLSAMILCADACGSRGSALVSTDPEVLIDMDKRLSDRLITYYDGDTFVSHFEPVRAIPQNDDWFENVWRVYDNDSGRDNQHADAHGSRDGSDADHR